MKVVQSHLGGTYFSDAPARYIEDYCEQCGDSDRIVLEFNEQDAYDEVLDYAQQEVEQQKLYGDDYWSELGASYFAMMCLDDGYITKEQYDFLCKNFGWEVNNYSIEDDLED